MIGAILNIVQGIQITIKVIDYLVPDEYGRTQKIVETNPFVEGALDTVVNCYETHKNFNFNFENTLKNLQKLNKTAFTILSALQCENCMYLNVSFLDVFDRKNRNGEVTVAKNKVNTYFSINYIKVTNNVIIYGCNSDSERIKEIYRKIANEIYKSII